jgi:tripartite-type tricarboxylate transporter receptor subunit TctC
LDLIAIGRLATDMGMDALRDLFGPVFIRRSRALAKRIVAAWSSRGAPTVLRVTAALLAVAIANIGVARAQTVADFYRGKQISLYVSFPPGGGYDIYARLFAPFFTRQIPGNPQVLVKNMEGGSGVRAAAYITSVTAQDGLSLGLFLDTLTLGRVLGGPGDFDPNKLVWIGRMNATATVALVWSKSRVQSIEDAKTNEIVIAGSVPSNSSSFIPTALNDLIGTKFKIILGYQGSPPMALAMERGEVDAIGGMSWEALQLEKREWLDNKRVKILFTQGARRYRELPDVPGLLDFATDARSRTLLGLLGSGPEIGRAIVAEPGIPAPRAAALRQAFMAAMADPEWIAEAGKHNLGLDALSGGEVQSIVAAAVATPKDVLDQARKYIGQ